MKFNFDEKTYQVNVKKLFDSATENDYIDLVEALGLNVCVPDLSEIGIDTMIVYDDISDNIVIQLFIDKDEIYIIEESDIDISQYERNMIADKMRIVLD